MAHDDRAFLERLKSLSPKQVMVLALELQRKVAGLEAGPQTGEGAKGGNTAVIGMGCRFPGGDGPEGFWQALIDGRDGVGQVPADRWDMEAWYDPDPGTPDRIACRTGGFIDHVDQFDATFFGLTPREAISMDPQHRLLLETALHALEDANIRPSALKDSKVGIYVGISTNDYGDLLSRSGDPDLPLDSYFLSGNALNFAAGRIAFTFGFKGPAVSIDTACSSSLVSVHLAAQALRAGECDVAIAGGVNLILSPFSSLVASRARMLSPTGHCRAFDKGADGMVRGEGCGLIVLKRESDAAKARDRIRAVLKGSAVNQNGPSSGITVPSRSSQENVIRDALAQAGATPSDIAYLETHGTGTALGDPIEAHGLGSVFSGIADKLPIGSVKTNLGHLESASGIAGLIKSVLVLEHRKIPPHLHLTERNPEIDWTNVPVDIPVQPTDLSDKDLVSVSSLGGSGTNAHAVLSSAETVQPAEDAPDFPVMFPVSAKSPAALSMLLNATSERLAGAPELSAAQRTAIYGRDHYPVRAAIIGESREALVAGLAGYPVPSSPLFETPAQSRKAGLAFLFSGQGTQYPGMGKALYDSAPRFREKLDEIAGIFAPLLDRDLKSVMFGAADGLDDTKYTQPALFALEVALADYWQSLGFKPTHVTGHSLGAFSAATVAGIILLETGVKLAAARGKLVSEGTERGAMAALFTDRKRAEELISEFAKGGVEVAAVNGAGQTVLAGLPGDVDAFVAWAEKENHRVKRLDGAYGFHSRLVDPVLDAWRQELADVEFHPPKIPFLSTGATDWPEATDPEYWVRHLRDAVDFERSLSGLMEAGVGRALEVGPGGTLTALAKSAFADTPSIAVPTLRKDVAERLSVLQAVGQLYESGLDPNWTEITGPDGPKAQLPSYPFDRKRYWPNIEPPLPPDFEQKQSVKTKSSAEPDLLQIAATSIKLNSTETLDETRSFAFIAPTAAPELAADLTAAINKIGGTVLAEPGGTKVETLVDLSPLADGIPAVDSALILSKNIAQAEAMGATYWLITRGAWPAADTAADQVVLTAMMRTASLELPEIIGGQIDLDPNEVPNSADLAGLLSDKSNEDLIAFRDGGVLAARLRRTEAARLPVWQADPDGLYLIVGGTGGIGRHMCRWLAAKGAKRLAVCGRSALSDANRAFLDDLDVAWAYDQVNAGDEAAFKAYLQGLVADGLKGAVHAAGTAGDSPVTGLTREGVDHQFKAKIIGATCLVEALGSVEPDLLLFMSSAAATWGSQGLAAYAGANGYLDTLAETAAAEGLPAASIAWGPWAGTGLATAQAEDWFAKAGIGAIEPDEALQILDQVAGQAVGAVTAAKVDWSRFGDVYQARRARPLISEFQGERISEISGPSEPSVERYIAATGAEREALILSFLQPAIMRVRGTAEPAVTSATDLSDLAMDSLMIMDLLTACKREFGFNLYPQDFMEAGTAGAFAGVIARELDRLAPSITTKTIAVTPPIPREKPDAIFVLSSPRSGSTLLRVMLAGHPGLFCPPELHLLQYENMGRWQSDLTGGYLDEGLLRALMERHGIDAEAAKNCVAKWADADIPVGDVYRDLASDGHVLVDKSPSYAADPETLHRAEKLFDRALYIHLVRHPVSVIDSSVRTRIGAFIGAEGDPYQTAEEFWVLQNRNVEGFFSTVPPDRHLRVSYENLVSNPEGEMRRICAAAGLTFDAAMLNPYEGERMTDGVYSQSLSIGDPNFLSHSGIDAGLAQAWQGIELPNDLKLETKTLARSLGYDVRSNDGSEVLQEQARAAAQTLSADPAAIEARKHLRDIGVTPPFMKQFGLGFDDGLIAALSDEVGQIREIVSLDDDRAGYDLPIGLMSAADAIREEGYGVVLPGLAELATARSQGLNMTVAGPVSDTGMTALAATGAMIFDLSAPGGALRAAGVDGGLSARAPALHGSFEIVVHTSAQAGRDIEVGIYNPAEPGDHPGLIILPGADAVLGPHLAAVPDRLISEGRIGPCRIVWAQAPRTLYLDPPAGGSKWESLIREELPELLGCRRPGLIGLSMGGLGALRAAFRNPGAFSSVAALAPAIEPVLAFDDMPEGHPLTLIRPQGYLEGLFGSPVDGQGQWQDHHPPVLAERNAPDISEAGLRIGLWCGDRDSLAWDGSYFLHKHLESQNIDHRFQRIAGERHGPSFFLSAMIQALSFCADGKS